MSGIILVLASFLASAVEMVEALTIVLAVGVTRGWRSPLIGVGAALFALALIITALGPALTIIPIDVLRLVVGMLLLTFGIFWGTEGTGVEWPGGEVALLAIVGFVLAVSLALIRILEGQRKRALPSATAP